MSQRRVARPGNWTGRAVQAGSISAGTELFSLCQTVSADGALSPRESGLLRAWLDRSGEVEVPARDFVRGLIEHVLTSGRVAPADLQALGRALEPSLPASLRRGPAALRLVGSDRTSRSDECATERVRNELLASACFTVAGCQDGRSPLVSRAARAGEPVLLVRERRGQGAAIGSAIEVCTANGKPLGYVPAHRATELAPLLDRGARYRAHLISASIGAHVPVFIVQTFLYRGDAALGFQHANSRRLAPRRFSPRAWMVVRLAVALLIAAAAALALRV